jgi:hypothetical protein
MTPAMILSRCRESGIPLSANGDRLHVGVEPDQIPADLLGELKAHKTELVALLANPWAPGGEYYERIRSGWRLSRTEDGGYVWLEPGTWREVSLSRTFEVDALTRAVSAQ